MQAMILAAGFGTRLLPYTKILAKPLFPLLNTPLLQLTINRLKNAGFNHIIVNSHYLSDQVKSLVDPIEGVVLQEEEQILGTGGALAMAQQHIRPNEPLLITNGDIYHTVDLTRLYSDHLSSDATVTLAVHDYPRFNKLSISDGKVIGFTPHDNSIILAFSGIHVINPEILECINKHTSSCIVDRYRNMVKDGQSIRAERIDDKSWMDMGTVEDYLDLHGEIICGYMERWPELKRPNNKSCLMHPAAECATTPRVDGWACVGRAVVGKNVTLQRTVVWDGAVVPDDTEISDTIVTPMTYAIS